MQLKEREASAVLCAELDRLRAEMERACDLAVAHNTEQLTREFALKSDQGGAEAQRQM